MSCSLKTPVKIPPDIDETYVLTPTPPASPSPMPMQISAKKARIIAQNDEQFDLYNVSPKSQEKKQNPVNVQQQRANANLAAILNLVEIQISLEKDYEILAVLENQKINLLEILKKKAGKESKFKMMENKAFFELQNKFSSLERAVDQKLNSILVSIENSQTTTNSWAKIASSNIQQEQQVSTISKGQQNSQTKAFAKATKQEQKQSITQAKKEAAAQYVERRLTLHIDQQIWAKFDGYRMRNQINDAFLQKEKTEKPIVASVTKSLTGHTIIVTTMPGYTADFLINKKQVWEQAFSPFLKSMEKAMEWSKLVIHGIPIAPFSMDDGLYLLKEEIETFNPEVKLLKNPR